MAGQASQTFEEDTGKRTFYYDHVKWIVGERPARTCDVQQTPHLVFESELCIRRVRNFPTNWRDLGARELYDLSWGT